MCSVRYQSDVSEMRNLTNVCWIHCDSLLDTNLVCRLFEIVNSIYFNKIFLCSKQSCIFSTKYLFLKYSISLNLSAVPLTVVMLFMSCINAVSAVQSSLFQVFTSQNRCLKMLWMCFSRRFQKFCLCCPFFS